MNSSDDLKVIKVPAVASIIMLLLAIPEGWPYGYYTLLRLVVCGSSVYVGFLAYNLNKQGWTWTMGFIALLFNPLIPIHLDKPTWVPIDLVAAFLFLIALFVVKPNRSKIGDGT